MATESRIQEIELQTVAAVAELKTEVKNLTKIIERLESTISAMADNYVTKVDHSEDLNALHKEIAASKKVYKIGTFLWSVFTAAVTAVVLYEVQRIITRG